MKSKDNPFPLFENIKTIIAETQHYIVRNVNAAMILAYFQIGKMIVEDEQQGSQRAEYAKETIARLSKELNREFGRGYSISNLEYIRSFYIIYHHRIPQSPIGEFDQLLISQTVIGKFTPFHLSWTH